MNTLYIYLSRENVTQSFLLKCWDDFLGNT